MADKIVELLVARKAAMPTVVAEDEERPEHGPLGKPVERPYKPVVEMSSARSETEDDGHIPQHVADRLPGVLLPAVLGDGSPDFR